MALTIRTEIEIYLERFINLFMPDYGFYHLKIYAYYKNGNSKIFCTPSSHNTYAKRENNTRNNFVLRGGILNDENCIRTNSVRVLHENMKQYMSESCKFQIYIDIKELLRLKYLYLIFELYVDDKNIDISNEKLIKSIEAQVNFEEKAVFQYFQIIFEEY